MRLVASTLGRAAALAALAAGTAQAADIIVSAQDGKFVQASTGWPPILSRRRATASWCSTHRTSRRR